jgi:hypothetical protein
MQIQFTSSILKIDFKKMEFEASKDQKASTYESYTFYFDNPEGFSDSDKILPLSMSKKAFDESGLKDTATEQLKGVGVRVTADLSPSKYMGAYKVRLLRLSPERKATA